MRVRVRERRGDTGQQDHDELDDVCGLHTVNTQAGEDHLVSIAPPMLGRARVSIAIVSRKPYLDVGHGDVTP